MTRLTAILIFIANISSAQVNESFLDVFLLEDELKYENVIDQYKEYDFSSIWVKAENSLIYGIIGNEHQRIRIKMIAIEKNPFDSVEYVVKGKSMVKETVCEFIGVIRIKEIKEVKELHFGVDEEYKDEGIKSQGILIAEYEFRENKDQNHSGIFKGNLFSRWYLDMNDQIKYDNIQSVADSYSNNAFIGIWKSYQTSKEKVCNWGDFRVPKANQDFDIGVGEFNVSEKYWKKGWADVVLKNQHGEIIDESYGGERKTKEWWE